MNVNKYNVLELFPISFKHKYWTSLNNTLKFFRLLKRNRFSLLSLLAFDTSNELV